MGFTELKRVVALGCSILFIVSLCASKSFADTNVDRCRVTNANQQSINLGLPRSSLLLPSTGIVKVLVAGVDFLNARSSETAEQMLAGFELSTVKDFYATASYGKLNLEFELVSEVLRLPISDLGVNERTISLEAARIIPNTYRFNDYGALLIVTTRSSSYSSSTASATSIVENATGRITNYSVLAGIKPNESRWLSSPWRTVAHEVGHLLGLMDLWNREDSTAWQGQTAAPFSLMNTGAGWGYAADFFGWEKWVLGWIPESDIKCLSQDSTEEVIQIAALGDSKGIRLAVIPISKSKVVAIEYRTKNSIDFGISKPGILVYTVDTTKNNFELPITLIPSEESLLQAFTENLRDYERFKKAPLAKFEFVEANGVQIANLGVSEGKGLLIARLSKSDVRQRLANLANQERAEAEAKAKAEAEANKAATKAASKNKSTITCKKGKLVKRITAINPKCPKGYKKR